MPERYLSSMYNQLKIVTNLTPTVDANLYRIYCSEFNKPTVFSENNDDVRISMSMQNILKRYIYDNLISRVGDMLDDIELFVKNDLIEHRFAVPEVVKNALDDTFIANTMYNNAVDPVVRLKYTLVEHDTVFRQYDEKYMNNYKKANDWSVRNRGSYNIDKQQILDFTQITKDRLYDLYVLSSRHDTVAEDFNTGFNGFLEYMYSLIFLLYSGSGTSLDNLINRDDSTSLCDSDLINTFYKYSHLSLASAICLYPKMMVHIPQDKNKCSTMSDSLKFLSYAFNYNTAKFNYMKCVERKLSENQSQIVNVGRS